MTGNDSQSTNSTGKTMHLVEEATDVKPAWYGSVSMDNGALQTPMMKQFIEIKSKVPDALLLFRMGDFYELFLEDANVAGRVLDLNVTSRNKKDQEPIPMAGIPFHALEGYLPRLAQAGFKVAIAEQRGDPNAKKMLERVLTRVVTPGVPWDTDGLESKESYWLVGIYSKHSVKGPFGIAALDVSTGEFLVTQLDSLIQVIAEIQRLQAKEVILQKKLVEFEALLKKIPHSIQNRMMFDLDSGHAILCDRLSVSNLNGFGIQVGEPIIGAAGALLTYVKDVTFADLSHVTSIQRYTISSQMVLDEATKVNLEILQPQRGTNRKHTLLHLLDKTKTAMGGRLLRKWLAAPLIDIQRIQRRQNAVEAMLDPSLRISIQTSLQAVYDLERLAGKLAQLKISPKSLKSMAESISCLPTIFDALKPLPAFNGFIPDLIPTELANKILEALKEDPPTGINEGNIFRTGYNKKLDELRTLTTEVKIAIAEMEEQQKEETGITSLKIKHNRVFGYFLEVTAANKDKVPESWIRKQTLANSERFITPELKEFEERILTAGEKSKALEQELYIQLRDAAAQSVSLIQKLAQRIAYVDVFCSLATVAIENRYCKPTVDLSLNLNISQSRHPIIERNTLHERFVPNDIMLNESRRQILLTGPNMSGKSTIMRQVALIVLMAQIGSFVPADRANIGICDTIFVRVGASDDLAEGRSTFMVEMSETAYILNHATEQSLLLLDEIGRGTSTYDGMSIAWAVAEAIYTKVKARCIFATHYHELTKLKETCSGFINMHVAIQEDRGEIRFLRILQEGEIGKSYGIQCARLAGLPRSVIRRASQLLRELEKEQAQKEGNTNGQMSLFSDVPIAEPDIQSPPKEGTVESIVKVKVDPKVGDLLEELGNLDLNDYSPFEALQELYKLQKRVQEIDVEGLRSS